MSHKKNHQTFFFPAIQTRRCIHIRGCGYERLRADQLQSRFNLRTDEKSKGTTENARNLRQKRHRGFALKMILLSKTNDLYFSINKFCFIDKTFKNYKSEPNIVFREKN